MLGIGIDVSIASANEVQDAIAKQDSAPAKPAATAKSKKDETSIMDKAVTYIKGAVDKQKAYDSVITKYGEELTDKQKAGLKSLCDEQHTEIPAGLRAGLDDTLPDPLVHGESDGRTLRWNLCPTALSLHPYFND